MSANITPLEADLLNRLASSRVTRSAVKVAAEWWEQDREQGHPVAVTEELVNWLLKDLNERGFVVYRLGMYDIPVDIRVTDEGYRAIGYVTRHAILMGSRRAYLETPSHPSDGTDFRNYKPFGSLGCSTVQRWPDRSSHLQDNPQCQHNRSGW